MKINIYSNIRDGAWGGGNQFLKALKNQFIKSGLYTNSISDADAVIFNGYKEALPLVSFWFKKGKKKIIYRLGPILSMHRKNHRWKMIDLAVVVIANLFADLVVFQSEWSYNISCKFGFSKKKRFVIIRNSVDESIFFKKIFFEKQSSSPITLIYTSWSSNVKKGFKYLKFLDDNLDFNKYAFLFIGNSPIEFKNIKTIRSLPSIELANSLRESDIFISPVEDDACSNALLEALACGLPSIATNSGGNPEIISDKSLLFSSKNDLLELIEKVSSNLKKYQESVRIKSIEEVAIEYAVSIKNLW